MVSRLLAVAALLLGAAAGGSLIAAPTAKAEAVTVGLFPPSGAVRYGNGLGVYATVFPVPPGGTLTYTADGVDVPGCTDITNLSGTIDCNYRWLTPGTYTVVATYSGYPGYDPGSDSRDIVVAQMSTVLAYGGPTSVRHDTSFTAVATLTPMFGSYDIVGEDVTFSLAGGGSCTDATDADGVAQCDLTMPASDAVLTISYAGSANGGYGEETINRTITATGPTTTTLSASPQSAPVGASIHLSAAVEPSAATGTVTIRNGSTAIPGCSNLPLVGGATSCDTTGLPANTNVLTAVYSGDALYDGSTSPSTNVLMSKHAVDLLPAGAPTGTVGVPYQLSATLHDLTLDVPAPGQTIIFTLGDLQCTGVTDAAGIAGCSVTPTEAGNATPTYTLEESATYLGDSAWWTIAILPAATTATVSSAGGQYLAPVDIDAVVSPADGAGTVDFFDGATPITGCADLALTLLTGSWTARCTTSTLDVGVHAITAVYGGSDDYLGSTSPVANVSITSAATSTVVSGPATAVFTAPATFTATVAPPPGGGTVDFSLAGGPIAGCEAVELEDVGGTWQASCTSALPVGPQTVTAVFSGTSSYATSTGTAPVNVAKAPTALLYTGPTSPASTAEVGVPATVSAVLTIMGTTPLAGQSVTFQHSADVGATCSAVTDGAGIATCALTAMHATEHGELNVSFAGTTEYEPSADEDPLDVDPATTTTMVVGPGPTPFGSAVTLIATVAPSDGTGTVDFSVGGDVIPGCEAVELSAVGPYEATCTATLAAGTVTVLATYSGSPDYRTSTGTATVDIVPAFTVAGYTGETTGTVGSPLTLSGGLGAVVGGGSLPLGGQTVTFTLADLSCTAITGPDGTTSCTVTPVAVAQAGTARIAFAGTAEFAAATADGTVAIVPAASTTSLSGPVSSLYSVPVTFVATVGPTNGGTVGFSADGVTIGGCDAVPVGDQGVGGQAACTTTSLGVGAHEISAAFSGTADYLPSAAAATSISVAVAPTSLTYTGPATATAGEPVSVSARLVVNTSGVSSASVATGAVALAVAPLATGDVPVVGKVLTFQLVDASCTATTDATGTASCTLTPTSSASSSELRITFAGGDGFAAAEEVVAVAVAAAPIPPATPAPTVPTTPADPGTLPATGGNGTPIGQLAALLLAAGLLALLGATRTRRGAARR